jgi:hypothetical protein
MVCYYWMPSDTNRTISTLFIVVVSSGEEEIISNATDKPTNYLTVLNVNFTAAQTQQNTLTRLFPALNRIICNIHAVVTTRVCGAQGSVLRFVGTLYVEQNYNCLTLWHSSLALSLPLLFPKMNVYFTVLCSQQKSVPSPFVISHYFLTAFWYYK